MLGTWQNDGGPLQLHPGDLGWYSLRGPAATAAAIRVWSHDEEILAIALLDGTDLLRFAIHPKRCRDDALALRIVADVNNPMAGILGAGTATIEARGAVALIKQLARNEWLPDDPWTPLHHDMTAWCLAAKGSFFDFARILSLRDGDGRVVAASAVWSAGEGRPGLIEPVAVHQAHRGRGYGTAMVSAAVDALRHMGSSSAMVCAEASNAGAVATYLSAGFTAHPEVADWCRSN